MAKFEILNSKLVLERSEGFETCLTTVKIPPLRRGSIYIIVLSVSMMVTVIGLASLFAVRVQRRSAEMTRDCAEAHMCAQSAVELGLYYVSSDPNWRTTRPNGTWLSNQQLGNGTFSLEGIDPDDGVLNDSDTDPLVLIGTGEKGLTRQKMQVKLVAEGGPLTCLGVSLHAGGDLFFDGGGLTSDQIISTNQNVSQIGTASITANVEAVGRFHSTTLSERPQRALRRGECRT